MKQCLRRQPLEGAIAADARIGADGQFGAVGDVDAGLLARQAVDQDAKRCEQARHQCDETAIAWQISEAIAILLFDAVNPGAPPVHTSNCPPDSLPLRGSVFTLKSLKGER